MLTFQNSKVSSHHAVETDDEFGELAHLRDELTALVSQLKSVVEEKAREAKDLSVERVNAGTDYARETIRSHPLASLSAAVLIGSALAIALMPRSQPRGRANAFGHYVSSADMAHAYDRARDYARDHASDYAKYGRSLTSTFETLLDSISKMDSSIIPAWNKVKSLLEDVRTNLK